MIELKVNNLTLDLPPSVVLERKFQTSIVRRNMEAEDYTFEIDLPLTDTNKAALLNPHLLDSNRPFRRLRAELIVDAFYSVVTLLVLEVNHSTELASVSIIGDYGGFWKDAAALKVNELYLDGARSIGSAGSTSTAILDPLTAPGDVTLHYTDCDTIDHINDVMFGTVVTDYVFYPAVDEVADSIPFLMEKQNYNHEEDKDRLPLRAILNPVYYNNGSDYGAMDPIKAYIETTYQSDTLKTNDRYFWVPFFKLAYVITKCFEELGYNLIDSDIITDTDFAALTLYNTFSINKCSVSHVYGSGGANKVDIYVKHEAFAIYPRDHVPDMYVTEFLQAVGQTFNLQYHVNYTTREVTIKQLGDFTFSNTPIIDLTEKALPKPVVSFEDFKASNGFNLKFASDPDNGASRENFIDTLDNKNVIATVDDHSDLAGVSSPSQFELVFVKAESAYHQYLDGEWVFHGYSMHDYNTSDTDADVEEISTKAVPVPSKIYNDLARMQDPKDPLLTDTNLVYDNDYLLPYSKIGICGRDLLGIQRYKGNNTGGFAGIIYLQRFKTVTKVKPNSFVNLVNWLGTGYLSTTATDALPMGNCAPYDGQGNSKDGLHLYWRNHDDLGLYFEYWEEFTKRVTDQLKVSYDVMWDAEAHQKAKLNDVIIKIGTQHYICDSAVIRMPWPQIANLELIRFGT